MKSVVGIVVGTAVAAATLMVAPAAHAAGEMPQEISVRGIAEIPGGEYDYDLNYPSPAGVYPGMEITISADAMADVDSVNMSWDEYLYFGYRADNDGSCAGRGVLPTAVSNGRPINQTIELPENYNGVAAEGFFCVYRYAEGTGASNFQETARSRTFFFPIGLPNRLRLTAPSVVPPGGSSTLAPGDEFTVVAGSAQQQFLQPGQSVERRTLYYGKASSSGGPCTVTSSSNIASNAYPQIVNLELDASFDGRYLCIRDELFTNLYPPRLVSEYRYVDVQRRVTLVPDLPDPFTQIEPTLPTRPNLPVLTSSAPNQPLEGKEGEAWTLSWGLTGSDPSADLEGRWTSSGYITDPSLGCPNAQPQDASQAGIVPSGDITTAGSFEPGRAGQYFCAYQTIQVAGIVHNSNVLYQQIIAADSQATPVAPVIGTPPVSSNGAAPADFTNSTTSQGVGAASAGRRLAAGDTITLKDFNSATSATAATVKIRARKNVKRGKKTRVRVVVRPKDAQGTADIYLARKTKRGKAKIIGVLSSGELRPTGLAGGKVTIPRKGTKNKKKKYYVIAEYTSPDGQTVRTRKRVRMR